MLQFQNITKMYFNIKLSLLLLSCFVNLQVLCFKYEFGAYENFVLTKIVYEKEQSILEQIYKFRSTLQVLNDVINQTVINIKKKIHYSTFEVNLHKYVKHPIKTFRMLRQIQQQYMDASILY